MRKTTQAILTAAVLALGLSPAQSQDSDKKKVVVTLGVLKSIADPLAGDDFEVTAISKPTQDPHYVQASPALMKKLRDASLFIEIGLQLELWANQVADGSGNTDVVKNAKGRLVASHDISREEVPKSVGRDQGDVHPEGNPHIWLDPIRTKSIADNIAEALKGIDSAKSSDIDARLKKFKSRIDEAIFGPDLLKEVSARTLSRKALDGTLYDYLKEKKLTEKIGGWLKKAEPLRGAKVLEYHKTWIYLAKLLGFEIVGSFQEKPGIEPAQAHIQNLKNLISKEKVKLIIVDNFYDPAGPNSLAKDTGIKVALVPGQPGGESGTEDYIKFIDFVIDRLLEAAK